MREGGVVEASMAELVQNLLKGSPMLKTGSVSQMTTASRLKEVPASYSIEVDGFTFNFVQRYSGGMRDMMHCKLQVREGLFLSILDHDPKDLTSWVERFFEVAVLDGDGNFIEEPSGMSGQQIVAKVSSYTRP